VEDAEENEAVYVAPVDEAGDASAPLAAKKLQAESDPEDGLVNGSRMAACDSNVDGAKVVHNFDAWRRAIEDLRKLRKPEAKRGDPMTRPAVDEIAKSLRQALEGADWGAVTAPALTTRPEAMLGVVKQLRRGEALQTLTGMSARHESHPRERTACGLWVQQILDQHGESLTGKPELRKALRPLLVALAKRLGSASRAGEVLSCLGKWRMAAGLARVRRQEQVRAKAAEASAGVNEVEAFSEADDYAEDDEESDAEDDDGEEEEVVPKKGAASRKDADSDSE